MVRRYGMMGVSTFAIDQVTFYDNTSSIFDEYVAHRLGQLPLTTPARVLENAEVSFVLDEMGPKTVYASDLKGSDSDVKVLREKIPIITLVENQKIRLEAKARLGNGRKHAKYQTGLLSFGADGDKYTFKLESFYQMEPKELMARACTAMLDDIAEMIKGLKKA
jgi:DNA-directed RNA polymerase subunit D